MTFQVRYFASLRDLTGVAEEAVTLAPGADLETLWASLVERYPGLGSLGYRPAVACDMEYADWTRRLDGVREVALLPPVSGG